MSTLAYICRWRSIAELMTFKYSSKAKVVIQNVPYKFLWWWLSLFSTNIQAEHPHQKQITNSMSKLRYLFRSVLVRTIMKRNRLIDLLSNLTDSLCPRKGNLMQQMISIWFSKNHLWIIQSRILLHKIVIFFRNKLLDTRRHYSILYGNFQHKYYNRRRRFMQVSSELLTVIFKLCKMMEVDIRWIRRCKWFWPFLKLWTTFGMKLVTCTKMDV